MKSTELFNLKGKVALVTGATQGIGRSMAQSLYEAGAELIITCRPSTDPTKAIAFIRSEFENEEEGNKVPIHVVKVDLAAVSIAEVGKLILEPSLKVSSTGKIDILVNNAGIYYTSEFEDFPDEEFDKVIHVNLTIPTKLTKIVGKHMIDSGIKGKIVFTSSLFALQGGTGCSASCVSKGGTMLLIKSLGSDWAKHGIRVNGIAPGWTMTGIVSEEERNDPMIMKRIPMGRWASTDEFKGPVLFLASEASSYVTGEILVVDGGWMVK